MKVMLLRALSCAVLSVLWLCLIQPASLKAGDDPSGDQVILDTSGFWRLHHTFRKPMIGGKPSSLGFDTAFPAKGWAAADFPDQKWARYPGPPFPPHSSWRKSAKLNVGWSDLDRGSSGLALLCLRGKFQVDNPARARLTLNVTFRGGIVVYMNGTEITRSFLPKKSGFSELATDYPSEAFFRTKKKLHMSKDSKADEAGWLKRKRSVTDIKVPASTLRKGVNVLGIEIHRAGYPQQMFDIIRKQRHNKEDSIWSTCGLTEIRLSGKGAIPNVVRPEGVQVWNSDVTTPDFDLDWGDPHESLQPLSLVGARNGSFSGKVVVGSRRPLRNIRATVSNLTSGGKAVIPASAMTIRYAVISDGERYVAPRYRTAPQMFHALDLKAPAEVPVSVLKQDRCIRAWKQAGTPDPIVGAVQPIWLSVHVPAMAKPGKYTGTLSITGADVKPTSVPVQLSVSDYRLPDPENFHTVLDIIQSPESVALQYNVPIYSDAHFKLLKKTFEVLGHVGNDSLYIPLICETNQGNTQSMVRWIRQGNGSYKHDFTPFEKYLDLALKHMGKPEIICLYIHDVFLAGGNGQKITEGSLVPVSGLDTATGKVTMIELPRYTTPEGIALWKPVFAGIRERLARHGLEKAILLGLVPDGTPAPKVLENFNKLQPGIRWMRHAHSVRRDLLKIGKIGYQCLVWTPKFPDQPDFASGLGWKTQEEIQTQCIRSRGQLPIPVFRLMCEMNIGGQQRGVGRIGLDFWPVVKSPKGKMDTIFARFPRSGWRNMDWVMRYCVNPGPSGARLTQRLMLLREGIQECEARTVIERALEKKKITGALAERARQFIRRRTEFVRIALDNHLTDGFAKDSGHAWWQTFGQAGYQWYTGAGWQAKSAELYELAAEVTKSAGK